MFKSKSTKKPSASLSTYTISEIICQILQTRDRLQIYHWKTKSHAKHKASDELVQSLTSNMDRFVETYLGSHPTEDKNFNITEKIELKTCTDTQMHSCLYSLLDYLRDLTEETQTETSIFPKFLRGSGSREQKKVINTDLLNIRDEMMSDIHKTLYLFTLQ